MQLNLADLLRAELTNYDLEVRLAESKIAYLRAIMDRCKGSTNMKQKRRFVYAKLGKEAWEAFLDDLLKAKESLEQGIDTVLRAYPETHRKIFWECLLRERSDEDVAAELGMTAEALARIKGKLNRDLHTLYRP